MYTVFTLYLKLYRFFFIDGNQRYEVGRNHNYDGGGNHTCDDGGNHNYDVSVNCSCDAGIDFVLPSPTRGRGVSRFSTDDLCGR